MADIDEFDRLVGAGVAGVRKAAGWTQADLAEELSRQTGHRIHQQTIVKIENGSRALKFVEAFGITEIFGIGTSDLLAAGYDGPKGDTGQVIIRVILGRLNKVREAVVGFSDAAVSLLAARAELRELELGRVSDELTENVRALEAVDLHDLVTSVEATYAARKARKNAADQVGTDGDDQEAE